ncbi:MAG: fructose-bisphosphate aldolase / 2-amino-3,7-dideoxy-D-threo-hept-6-ulosonate synthase [Gaiellales bacterium]|nr:fructose-bisphosphate aldolase / 2-amino-3,7-dideoxy-D-threo-hept-6-ulosonate synthase [Gaiellales bacterium]
MTPPLAADGRAVIVAVDHPLYSWPCRGLEHREALLRAVVSAGADAVILTYGTLRDFGDALGDATPILKLDLTTLTLDGYGTTEYVAAWTVDDAVRLGATAVLTYVQVGSPFELAALQLAGRVAAAADVAGVAYVCEIMPQGGDSLAIAACCRTAAELGARLVKTSFPQPASAIAEAIGCDIPVVLAGGDPRDPAGSLADAADAMRAGAAGVAFGRNVWGATDPAAMVRDLAQIVHGAAVPAS